MMLRRPIFILIGVCLIGYSVSHAYPPKGAMSEGADAWVRGDVESARKYYSLAATVQNCRVNAWYNLGYLALWEDRIDSAATLFNRALEYNPDFPPAHLELGKLALSEGKVITANQHFEKAVDIPYASFRPWHLFGETKLALGDTIGAEDAFAKALDNHPEYHHSLESLAKLALAKSDTLTALSYLEDAVRHSPAPSTFEVYIAVLDSLRFHHRADSVRQDYLHIFPQESDSTLQISSSTVPSYPVGEYLRYSFRWEFVKLGTAEMTVTGWDTLDVYPLLKVHVSVRSAPLIFVINVHDDYDIWIDPVTGVCHRFDFHMNSYGVDLIGQWEYRYQDGEYVSRTVVDDGYIFGAKQQLPVELVDGVSLIYHLRYRTAQVILSPFHFVIDDEYKTGEMIPESESRLFQVEDREIESTRYQGILHCRGIVGLSGNFQAWFSQQPTSLLLRAEARIFLGSLNITLVEYSP